MAGGPLLGAEVGTQAGAGGLSSREARMTEGKQNIIRQVFALCIF